ncbi:MAG: uroporphyrinogen-III C-methyltransferase [Paracoccaceae bacterium]|nr:MAG: uroporphyrinogen-III C-methyltransferase [Paracoccaceae bacterium]
MLAPAASATGRITLVGAGPGSADLLTFRAADRLRHADAVYYDRLVDPAVLALANPRATCIFAGKEVGAHAWPQERINRAICADALAGLHVVRLKSGDPGIFGRAAEEIAAARACGIPVEVVPGITAASAAAASLCAPLTERGRTERLTLATATCRPGETWGGLAGVLVPGTTMALYMAMHRLPQVQADLRALGLPEDHPVLIAAHAETPRACHLATTLGGLVADAARARIGNPAVIFIRHPHGAPAAHPAPSAACVPA